MEEGQSNKINCSTFDRSRQGKKVLEDKKRFIDKTTKNDFAPDFPLRSCFRQNFVTIYSVSSVDTVYNGA